MSTSYNTITLIIFSTMYAIVGFIIGFTFAIKNMMVELNQKENNNEAFKEEERKKTY